MLSLAEMITTEDMKIIAVDVVDELAGYGKR
jgi:hypothetical protein